MANPGRDIGALALKLEARETTEGRDKRHGSWYRRSGNPMIIEPSFTPSQPRGFLVVDGVNGAGKSTLIQRIVALLESKGRLVQKSREPGGTPLGLSLRKLLLESKELAISSSAELFLFAADRAEHIAKVIEPALHRGEIVISDRYHYSTAAFQGYGRGLPMERVNAVTEIAAGGCPPDLVLLLDLDPAEGLRRTRGRTENGLDAFEDEELEFHQRIRAGFLDQARKRPEPFLIVDATKSPDEIFSTVTPLLDRWLAALPPFPQGPGVSR
jgi:dTMP kinase